jgi:hypothetical protein
VIDLARHATLIGKQIRFVARHALGGCRADDVHTIEALTEIILMLRKTADALAQEKKRREASTQDRTDRNFVGRGACEGPKQQEKTKADHRGDDRPF